MRIEIGKREEGRKRKGKKEEELVKERKRKTDSQRKAKFMSTRA